MVVQVLATVVGAFVAVLSIVEGVRRLSTPHRLREAIAKDVEIANGLGDGPVADELRRSAERRSSELVVMVECPSSVILLTSATLAGMTGAPLSLIGAYFEVGNPDAMPTGLLLTAVSLVTLLSEWRSTTRQRRKFRAHAGFPDLRVSEDGERPSGTSLSQD